MNHLIQHCIKGDRRSQREMYDLLAPEMYRICFRYMRTKEDAEDVMQDGFVYLFRYLSTYRGEGSFEGWARRIFANVSVTAYRKRKQLYFEYPEIDYRENGYDRIRKYEIQKTINNLPNGYRSIFTLFTAGYHHHEIASCLNIQEGTSRSQYVRAKKMLQKTVEI